MVWGYVTALRLRHFKLIDNIMNAAKHQQILKSNLLLTIAKLNVVKKNIFQQDGAACYTAKTTKRLFSDYSARVFFLTFKHHYFEEQPIVDISRAKIKE